MKVLTLYRNVCAHNERLFSYKSRFDIPDTIILIHTERETYKNTG